MGAEKLDVMAFAAHCDDIEITSGGLLIKLADMGYKTGACDLTAGEMGTKGSSDDRLAEASEAGRIMGLAKRINLGMPDGALEFNRASILRLAQIVRDYQPHLVILPYWEQRHPDHRVCSLLLQDACYFAGLKKIDLHGDPHRPFKILFSTYYREIKPSFLVDISDQHNRKLEAVRAYKSQFDGTPGSKQIFHPGADIFEYIKTRDRNLGLNIKSEYAEPYFIKEPLALDDPMKLSVKSI